MRLARRTRHYEMAEIPDTTLLTYYQTLDDALQRRGVNEPRGGDDRQREMFQDGLIERHENFLRGVVKRMAPYYDHMTPREDLEQLGKLGALVAYDRWDKSIWLIKQNRLTSFMWPTVKSYIMDSIDQNASVACPTHQRALRRYVGKDARYNEDAEEMQEFEERNGLTTPEKIVAARMRGEHLRGGFSTMSLNQGIGGVGEEMDRALIDVVADDAVMTDDQMDGMMDLGLMLGELSGRAQTAIKHVLQEEMTYGECATMMGTTSDTVRGLLMHSRKKLREELGRAAREIEIVDSLDTHAMPRLAVPSKKVVRGAKASGSATLRGRLLP